MIRKFKILDDVPIDFYGYLYYNTDTKEFRVELREGIDLKTCIPFFDTFIEKGIKYIEHEKAIKWIRTRMMPPGRHAIGVALREMGLTEYDEFNILLFLNGRCDMDECYIEEVK